HRLGHFFYLERFDNYFLYVDADDEYLRKHHLREAQRDQAHGRPPCKPKGNSSRITWSCMKPHYMRWKCHYDLPRSDIEARCEHCGLEGGSGSYATEQRLAKEPLHCPECCPCIQCTSPNRPQWDMVFYRTPAPL